MSTAAQYTAAAVLGVIWFNRDGDSGGCTNSCSGGCANNVPGAVQIIFWGLSGALCSVMWRSQLFLLTNHRRALSYMLCSDWSLRRVEEKEKRRR